MIKITLERIEQSDQGTFGILTGCPLVFTGELPWRENRPEMSCVPEGIYPCYRTFSPKLQRFTYMLHDVPGRFVIRIHSANWVGDRTKGLKSEVDGCIALGKQYHPATETEQARLGESVIAVREFENWLKEKSFLLEIVNRVIDGRTIQKVINPM